MLVLILLELYSSLEKELLKLGLSCTSCNGLITRMCVRSDIEILMRVRSDISYKVRASLTTIVDIVSFSLNSTTANGSGCTRGDWRNDVT